MKIVYIGNTDPATTTRQMADALVRIGHEVELIDAEQDLGLKDASRLARAWHFRSGYRTLQRGAVRWARALELRARSADAVWVDSGEWFGPDVVDVLRGAGAPVVLFNQDDPTGQRDGRRFDMLRAALAHYDLFVTMHRDAVGDAEFEARGVRRFLRVTMSYDEVVHRPFDDDEAIAPALRSEVAFVGTWIRGDGRDRFVHELLRAGVPVTVWGNHWPKAPAFAQLAHAWRGPALKGRDYVGAIQAAKVTLGLISHGNRDVHTRRSTEVTYAGGLLCAERTRMHESLYRADHEAVFWSDARECARHCLDLLADDDRRQRIRAAGMRRVRALGVGNEDIVRQVLDALGQPAPRATVRGSRESLATP